MSLRGFEKFFVIEIQHLKQTISFVSVNDSIKYGPILAAALFAAKWITNAFELYSIDLVLKALILVGMVFFFLFEIKKSNQAYFPFKVAWLSAFNIMVLASIIYAALIVVLKDLVAGEAIDLKVAFYFAFIEFLIVEFFGIIASLIVAFLMRKKD